jgi:hypothetical protein
LVVENLQNLEKFVVKIDHGGDVKIVIEWLIKLANTPSPCALILATRSDSEVFIRNQYLIKSK